MAKDICGIYQIRKKATGECYVGQSANIHRRWEQHKYQLRAVCHHCSALQDAWLAGTEEDFEFLVLEVAEQEQLCEKEELWIHRFGNQCYNKMKGAKKYSPHKVRIRDDLYVWLVRMAGREQARTGEVWSVERYMNYIVRKAVEDVKNDKEERGLGTGPENL